MILALVSQKGGVGKSTLARLVAVALAPTWRVRLADLDATQGTASLWAERRAAEDVAPAIDVRRYRAAPAAIAAGGDVDLLILDGPAHAERGGIVMAAAADLTLIPAGYSIDDLEPQVRAAYELEEAGVPAARIRFALTRVGGSAAEARQVRGYLDHAGVQRLSTELRHLPSIRQASAHGRAACETPFAHINDQARQLVAEIAGIIVSQEDA